MLKKLLERISIPTPKHLKPEPRKRVLMRRYLAAVLCGCMVAPTIGSIAMATEEQPAKDPTGLCEHHTVHDANCGYVEAVEGAECQHIHDENCGYVEAKDEVPCYCADQDGDGVIDHAEGCGYQAPVEGQLCNHVHDADCGYAEAVEGQPCGYVCEICAKVESDPSDDAKDDIQEGEQTVNSTKEETQKPDAENTDGLAAPDMRPVAVQTFLTAVSAIDMDTFDMEAEGAYEALKALYDTAKVAMDAMMAAVPNYQDYEGVADALALMEQLKQTLGEDLNLMETGDAAVIGETSYGTLQLAIRNAKDGDTIKLTRDVSESVLAFSATIDLNGHTWTGYNKAALSAMALRDSANITLKNGTIVAAEGYRAIVASGVNLKLENMTMNPSGSLANEGLQSSNFGGGCVWMDKGTLTVENCTFSGDAGTYKESASHMGPGKTRDVAAYGGHINVGSGVSSLRITNSTFTGSQSEFGAVAAFGGAITAINSTFNSNTNGLQLNSTSICEINQCTFTNNIEAINASKETRLNLIESNFESNGGKKPVVQSSGAIIISGGKFKNNNSTDAGIIRLKSGSSLVMDGSSLTGNSSYGVVELYDATNVTMKNVTATGNTGISSMNSGGSVLNAKNCKNKTITLENVKATGNQNTAQHGGAIYIYNSSVDTAVNITGCTITGNTANNCGGGIYLDNKGTTTVTDTIISGNTANGSGKVAGGGIYVNSTSGTITLNGATHIYNNETPKATVKHLTVGAAADIALASNKGSSKFASENSAQRAILNLNNEISFTGEDGNKYTLTKSDAVGLQNYKSGSTYYWPVGYYTIKEEPAVIYLNSPANGHVADNKTFLLNDLAQAVATAQQRNAKTIYVCGNVDIDTSEEITALNTEDITFARCPEHPNGYMFTIKSDVTLENAHIDGNKVDGNAALIFVPRSGHLTVAGKTRIENGKNAAEKGEGGGIHVHQGSLTMTGGTITNNSAKQGGGIYAYGGKLVSFEGGTVSSNTATGGNGGGGAYIGATSSEFGVRGGRTIFDGNETSQMGGGVCISDHTGNHKDHKIYQATFKNNKSTRYVGAYEDGGAIYIWGGTTVHMKNVYITNGTNRDTRRNLNNYAALSLCSTGKMSIFELDGVLSIRNGVSPDIGTTYTHTTSSDNIRIYLSNYAPGGGSISYTNSKDETIDISQYQFHKGAIPGLFSHASEEAIGWAEEKAETGGVYIDSNYANQHGSGIMCNGNLIIGTETTELQVKKVWADGNEKHANDQVMVYLTRKGKDDEAAKIVDAATREDASVILSAANNWTYTWTNLGKGVEWGVKEAAVNGYTSTVEITDQVKGTEFEAIASPEMHYLATLTNTPGDRTNKLVIKKTAIGLDPDADYKFTLKLDNVGDKVYTIQMDGTLYPIYNNEITFYLKDQQSAVIDGLPEGFTYELTEESSSEYNTYQCVTADTEGRIKTVDVVNMAKTSISGEKTWVGDTDEIRPGSIMVTLLQNGEIYKYENYKNPIEVKPDKEGKWLYKFEDLPLYDAEKNKYVYTIKEDTDEGTGLDNYVTEYQPQEDDDKVINITNTYAPPNTLTVSKQVVGGLKDDSTEWKFKVELSNIAMTNVLNPTYTRYTATGEKLDKKPCEFPIQKDESSGKGKATINELVLKHGQYAVFESLPNDTQYVVTEINANEQDYKIENSEIRGTIGKNESGESVTTGAAATFVNNRAVGDLSISKTVTGNAGETDREWKFEVTLTSPSENITLADSYTYTVGNFEKPLTLTEGKGTITLTHGETAKITGLPVGTTYTVTEVKANEDNYTTTVTGNGKLVSETGKVGYTGEIEADTETPETSINPTVPEDTESLEDGTPNAPAELAEGETSSGSGKPAEGETSTPAEPKTPATSVQSAYVAFTNHRENGSLSISKEVAGNAGDKTKDWTFNITLKAPEGKKLETKYDYTMVNGDPGILTLIPDGETFTGSIKLKHGQTAKIIGLPAGTTYTVVESSENLDGHTPTATGSGEPVSETGKVGYTGTIKADAEISAKPTIPEAPNTPTDPTEGETPDTPTDPTEGETPDTPTDPTEGETPNTPTDPIEGDTPNTPTDPIEGDAPNTSTDPIEGETLDTPTEATKVEWVAFVNTKNVTPPDPTTGSLTIHKTVTGVSTEEPFTFILKLAPPAGGNLDGMKFSDNSMVTANGAIANEYVVTLKYNAAIGGYESLVVSGLPQGTQYNVTETETNGYTVSLRNQDGTPVLDTLGNPVTMAEGTITESNLAAYAGFNNAKVNTQPGSLTISKTVSGNRSSTQRDFTFTVILRDASGNLLTGTYPFTGSREGNVENGTATFLLRHGQSITISNLPVNTRYEVSEEAGDYSPTVSGGSGTIQAGTTSTAAFDNYRSGGGGGGGGRRPTPDTEIDEPPTPQVYYPGEEPDPNEPDSPDEITIVEEDVPQTYIKTWDPENEEYVYIPEEPTPLAPITPTPFARLDTTPKTDDPNHPWFWLGLCFASILGIGLLKPRKNKEDE